MNDQLVAEDATYKTHENTRENIHVLSGIRNRCPRNREVAERKATGIGL